MCSHINRRLYAWIFGRISLIDDAERAVANFLLNYPSRTWPAKPSPLWNMTGDNRSEIKHLVLLFFLIKKKRQQLGAA